MPIARPIPSPLIAGACVALAASLIGCTSGRLSSEPPAGVRLDGMWKVDRGLSDDPQKIIDQLRAQSARRVPRAGPIPPRRRGGPTPAPDSSDNGGYEQQEEAGGGPDTRGSSDTGGADGRGSQAGPGSMRQDPLRWSPVMHVLSSYLSRGEFLTIHETPDQMVFDYGGSVRRFTPGEHSVVSAEGGVADQTTGWKGNEYVINIRAQDGPSVVERYGLSPDHQHLVSKVRVSGGSFGKFDLTRVYEHTEEIAPRAVPSSD